MSHTIRQRRRSCSSQRAAFKFLRSLEISDDCDCPLFDEDGEPLPPCPHVLAADHNRPLRQWADLLAQVNPDEYADPPPPYQPAFGTLTEEKIAVYRQRYELGVGLWHSGDSWRYLQRTESEGLIVDREANGRIRERATL